jgi:hypothetical protein
MNNYGSSILSRELSIILIPSTKSFALNIYVLSNLRMTKTDLNKAILPSKRRKSQITYLI